MHLFKSGILLLVGLLLLGSQASAVDKKPLNQNRVLVRVNGNPILAGEFEWQWRRYLRKVGDRGLVDKASGASREAFLEHLIRQELACQEALAAGLVVDPQIVNQEIGTLEAQFVSKQAFALELARLGLTPDLLRRQIEKSFLIRRWVEETYVVKQQVSEQKARAWYQAHQAELQRPEQVCARHLLVKIDPAGGDQARQQARSRIKAMRQRWLAGESFAALCHEFSQCPSAAQSGDLGCFSRHEMIESFADVAFSLLPWDVSDIVETDQGFHLIQVYERKKAAVPAYAEVREDIFKRLRAEKAKAPVDSFLQAKRRQAVVEFPPSS